MHGPDTPSDAPKHTPSAIRRIPQIFDKPVFFHDGVAYSDIVQGKASLDITQDFRDVVVAGALGDCWFLSAVAAVSTKPELIEKLCVAVSTSCNIYIRIIA